MKKTIFGSITLCLLLLVTGCQQYSAQADTPATTVDAEGFRETEPSEWVEYMVPVREYMHYRTQAVIKKDINILWNEFKNLKKSPDPKQGINAEKSELDAFSKTSDFVDANFNVESYERIKVKQQSANQVVVLVHGSIVYLRSDFDESGGEYLLKVFLERKNGKWMVVKTDEYTLPEYKEWLEKKNKKLRIN